MPHGEAVSPLERWQAVLACKLTGASKAVLFAVACRDGGKAGCTASVARLSADSGVSPNSTRRALHAMAEAGLLSCSAPEYGAKVYRVQWDALAAYEPPVKAAPTTPTVVAPLPQRDPSQNGTPPTEVGPPSQSGRPPLPQWEPNKETNQEENQEVLMSTSADAERDHTKPAAPKADTSHLDLSALGSTVKAPKVSKDAWAVFDNWRQRQARPASVLLTKPRLGLINAALKDYPVGAVVNVVRLAYEAPVGPHGLPENYEKPWRTDKAGRPGLEMLLRQAHIARNVEMAAGWLSAPRRAPTPNGTPNGHPTGRQVWDLVCQWFNAGEIGHRAKSGTLGKTPADHAHRKACIQRVGARNIKTRDQYTERRLRDEFIAAYSGGPA
jgi:hypothetical protein